MEVILRHKKREPWSGVIKYKNCFDYIGPVLTRSGNSHTGLTAEDAERLEKLLNFLLSKEDNFNFTFYL